MTFQVTPTQYAQAESLRQFMRGLDYDPARSNGGFRTHSKALKANSQISTATAIKLHNLSREDWKPYELDNNYFYPAPLDGKVDILISEYTLDVIMASKVVQKVKFQASRKAVNGLVFPPDENANLVRVTKESYKRLIGIA